MKAENLEKVEYLKYWKRNSISLDEILEIINLI
jgi:hypothetical protein